MAMITEIINSFDQNSTEYDTFINNLLLNDSDIPFNVEDVRFLQNNVLTAVNARINQESTRCNGLIILERILPTCSKEALLKHGILWMTKATQVIENVHSNCRELTIACKVIGNLIIQCKKIPEIQKHIATQNVKQLITVIDNLKEDGLCGAIYYLIAVLLYHYPEVCERYQTSIKKMILKQMESEQTNLVNGAARCYSLLTKATERSFKPIAAKPMYTGWTYSQVLICNNLHMIMDKLFSGLIELTQVDIWDSLDLPEISEEHIIEFYMKQKLRFSNLCIVLSTMLREYYVKYSTIPTDILQVICRGLAITPQALKDPDSFKHKMLYLILPKLHISLLNLLDTLITGFGQNLIPWGRVILRLFQQMLQWTDNILENNTTISGSKPFKNVRISVYKCMKSWLLHAKSLSGIETVADECISCILKDIVPGRDYISLTIQKTQHLSKRALKRHRDSQYEKSPFLNNTVDSTKDPCLNADLCKEALTVLESIFFSGSGWLKQSFFKNVQNVIVPLSYNIYLDTTQQNFYKKDAKCRASLLKVLKALEMNPHSRISPPTQYSIEIFEIALKDNDVDVIHEAQLALMELEKIIHPVAPSLQLTKSTDLENGSSGSSKRQRRDTDIENPIEFIEQDTIIENNDKIELNTTPVINNSSPSVENENNVLLPKEKTLEDQKENESPSSEIQSQIQDENIILEFSHALLEEETEEYKSTNNKKEDNDGETSKMDETSTSEKEKDNLTKITNKESQYNNREEDTEQQEILQLFQDIPKDD